MTSTKWARTIWIAMSNQQNVLTLLLGWCVFTRPEAWQLEYSLNTETYTDLLSDHRMSLYGCPVSTEIYIVLLLRALSTSLVRQYHVLQYSGFEFYNAINLYKYKIILSHNTLNELLNPLKHSGNYIYQALHYNSAFYPHSVAVCSVHNKQRLFP
jgi:hypothetical protein